MMCEEAQRLWGPRADAPTDVVAWEVTSMGWEFHVADGVENLHAFIYNVLDKAANATVVDVSMENGMIVFVVAKNTVSPLAALKSRIAEQIEAAEVGGGKKLENTPKKQKSKRSADDELDRLEFGSKKAKLRN